jgi:DNA-binding NtrC family response regulator
VIEERVVHRLGSRKEIPVDVRILAATNKDLPEAVRDRTLREDLLYRLNVITIHLPLLSERMEDLPLLTQHLVTRLAAKHNRAGAIYQSGGARRLAVSFMAGKRARASQRD